MPQLCPRAEEEEEEEEEDGEEEEEEEEELAPPVLRPLLDESSACLGRLRESRCCA